MSRVGDMCAAILNHAASSASFIRDEKKNRKEKEKEKKLTVQPIRKTQEKPRQSLKKTLRFKIQPEHVLPLETQVAGHGTEDLGTAKHRGLLLHQDGFVLKPVQAPPKGEREIDFYRRISSSLHPTDTELYTLTAKFYGIESMRGGGDSGGDAKQHYLVLEDLTQGMRRPCVMDIKIGARTYGPDASPAKQRQEDSKYLGTKKPLGFSVLGIISRQGREGALTKRWDKTFGLNLATEKVSDLLHNFLNWHEEDSTGVVTRNAAKISLARHFHRGLADMAEFFRHRQRSYHFYASSLLFVYDYDVIGRMEEEVETAVMSSKSSLELANHMRLKLIDFAHVFPAAGSAPDENFLFGIENLRDIFHDFLRLNGEDVLTPS